jgi:hypothetical protein
MLYLDHGFYASQRCSSIAEMLPISHAFEVHVSMSNTNSTIIPLTQDYYAIVDTSDFQWLSQWKWYYHSAGYAARTKKYKGKKTQIFMHRVILQTPTGLRTDHKNRNGLDNRRDNLRIATPSGNNCNRRKGEGTSVYKGVCWDSATKKWRGSLQVDKKVIRLGRFSSEIDAARSYDRAAKRYHGAFAVLNFPGEE